MRNLILVAALSLAVVLAGCAPAAPQIAHQGADIAAPYDKSLNDDQPQAGEPTSGAAGNQANGAAPGSTASGAGNDAAVNKLQTSLKHDVGQLKGAWAIYVKDLNSGAVIEINNKRMRAASLIKLFIMARVYYDLDVGNLKSSSKINGYLKQMITVSHNEATNSLVKLIGGGSMKRGMQLVNDYAAEMGFGSTEQQRDLKDSRPVPIKEENWTSVADCGKILEMIYNGELVNQKASQKMLDLLLAQTRRAKIPAGVPKGIEVANKTGELGSVENDAAIVFAGNDDYILCIMSDELTNTTSARASIKSLSATVYKAIGKR